MTADPARHPPMKGSRLEERVTAAAEAALAHDNSVSPIDVMGGIGWLTANMVDRWRAGRVDHLEQLVSAPREKRTEVLAILHRWGKEKGLEPTEVAYLSTTRDRRPLQFTPAGDPELELAYRIHWLSPELTDKARERLTERQSRPADLVVIAPLREFTCEGCGGTGEFLIMEGDGPLCMTCADMGHLVFLPAGDAALTRRARKASVLSAVVIRFSRTRQRYERRGILVEEGALTLAEEQCLADEEARARRRARDRDRRAADDVEFQTALMGAITSAFPGCPPPRAEAIARHAATRGSGRVGRSAAGRALDEDAVTLAVVASVRHEDTNYDELLMAGMDRTEARARVRAEVDRVLASWRGTG